MVGGKHIEFVFAWNIVVVTLETGNTAVFDEIIPFDLALEIVEHIVKAT
jgi:hypothetical protein